MKMKIFALIMAILCLTMLFAACSKDDACEEHVDEDKNAICDVCEAELDCEEHNDEDADYVCDICGDKFNVTAKCTQHTDEDGDKKCDVCKADFVACTDHKDADANKICDTCGASIVAITQLEKPVVEERVDMVVNQAPTDAAISEFYQTTMPEFENVTTLEKYVDYSNYSDSAQDDRFVYINDNGNKRVYNTELHTVVYETYSDNAQIFLEDNWFIVQYRNDSLDVSNQVTSRTIERTYYTYSGASFATLSWYSSEDDINVNEDGQPWYAYLNESVDTSVNTYNPDNYDAILIKETLYIIDVNANTCAQTTTMNLFVNRPDFVVYNDKYGIVYENNTFYFYDLSKWIECTGTYDVPGYAYDLQYWLLDNGKMLVQYSVMLSNNATSFDYYESGNKMDLVYTVIDPATAEAKNVEFGYLIASLRAIDDDDTTYNTEIDLNRVEVYPIVNDYVDYYNDIVLLVDSDLNVKINETEAFDDATIFYLVANNRFLVETYYENGQYRRELVDEKGEVVAYVPLTADLYETYIKFEGKYYNFDMELILDPEEKQVSVYSEQEQFLILVKYDEITFTTSYYYFDTETAQTAAIVLNPGDDLEVNSFGYIITTDYYNNQTNTQVYGVKIYDTDNKLVKNMANFDYYSCYYDSTYDGYYISGMQYDAYGFGTTEEWLLK